MKSILRLFLFVATTFFCSAEIDEINKLEIDLEIDAELKFIGQTPITSKFGLTTFSNVVDPVQSGFKLLDGAKNIYFSLTNKGSLLGHSFTYKYDNTNLIIDLKNLEPVVVKFRFDKSDGYKFSFRYQITILSDDTRTVDLNKLINCASLSDMKIELKKNIPYTLLIVQDQLVAP
jgi:hypothetical protein